MHTFVNENSSLPMFTTPQPCSQHGQRREREIGCGETRFLSQSVPAVRALREPQHEGSFVRARACHLALDMFPPC